MNDETPDKKPKSPSEPSSTGTPKRRLGLLRYLALGCAALLALLVIVYFVVTSSGFITGVIVPRVGKAIGAEISVGSVALRPFSSVEVRNVKVKTIGDELLLELASLKATYRLMDIIGGKITVNSVEVDSPTVHLVQQADGKSNLDPILKTVATTPSKPKAKSEKKTILNIGPVNLKNANLHITRHEKGGGRMVAEARSLNFSLDSVKHNQPLKASLDGRLNATLSGPKQSDAIAATLKGAIQTELNDDLMPKAVRSDLTLTVDTASGSFTDAAQLATTVKTDLSLTEIKQLVVNFAKGSAPLGQVAVSGPFDALKQEGKLKISVTGIGNEVLSLVGAKYGIFFGSTKLAANYEVELKNSAKTINTTGTLTGDKFSLRRRELTTPTLDFRLNYSVAVDLPKSVATISAFNFNANQSGRTLLSAALSKPMVIDWGKGAEALDESALELAVNQLSLADWRTFLGTNITAGSVSGKLNLLARKAGKDITLDLDTRLTGLAAAVGANRIERADVQLSAKGQVAELSRVTLSEFGVRVAQAAQPVIALTGSGSLDSARMDAQFQADVDANLVAAARLLNRPDLKLSSGTLKFTGKVAQKNQSTDPKAKPVFDQSVVGSVRLEKLTGQFASNKFDRFELITDLDAEVKNQVATIHKANGSLSQAGLPGGSFETSGRVDTAKSKGEVKFKLVDLNQNIVQSFAAALGKNQLKSVSIGAAATATFDEQAGSAVKGLFEVANLVIIDPAGQLPQTPLSVKVNLDAVSPKTNLFEIKKLTGEVLLGTLKGGAFDVTGSCQLGKALEKGQVALKLTDLNQNALRPFLASALGETKLDSVSINANANATFDATGQTAVKADAQIANLRLTNPKANLPKEPLAIGLSVDGSMAKQVVDLRHFQLKLTPTQRAKNELSLTGRVDLSKTNAIVGNLKLAAEALDVTPYYDIFAAPKGATTATPAAQAPKAGAQPPAAPQEPPAVKLPIKDFTVDVSIGRFFLREIALSNLVVVTKLDATTVAVDPFKLTFNGAPVSAQVNANLGVPGYQYDVRANVNRLPIAPIVDTFVANMAGKAKGDLLFDTHVKGAGVIGESLRRALAGNLGLTLTNATIILPDPNEVLKGPIGTTIKIVLSVIGPLAPVLNVGVDDLLKPPISFLDTKVNLGGGQVDLKHFIVASEAFRANAAGTVTIAPVLTNSPINDIPVDIALSTPLAKKARLAKADADTSGYTELPNFVKLGGTIGESKTEINKLVISGLLLKSVSGVPGALGGKAGGIMKGVGGLLTGETPEKSTTTSTNKTDATQPAIKVNPFDLFKKKK